MFQRVGAVAFKKDLTNTLKLCKSLGDPQYKFKTVHVAGTNGKGSTSHMLASILQSAGYKTGLYTSPHLKEFTERIKINGKEIEELFVVRFVNKIMRQISEVNPSFFELTVAMALDYFAHEKVDVAVIEVGLGGRLDSTNVITPELSVITNIGWDHMDILGDTLEKIASEKAGIIKQGIPVVVSERQPDIEHVFIRKSQEMQSSLSFASDSFKAKRKEQGDRVVFDVLKDGQPFISDLSLPLQGFYQEKNLSGVVQAVEKLMERQFVIDRQAVLHGLEQVVVQTGLKGRWQTLTSHPLMVCDTGHNVDGVREVLRQIQSQSYQKLHMVWGMVKDKDVNNILALLPKEATYYFCQAKIPRAMEASVLAGKALSHGLSGHIIPDVNEAKRKAMENADRRDLIFIGGSTFVVAEIEEL